MAIFNKIKTILASICSWGPIIFGIINYGFSMPSVEHFGLVDNLYYYVVLLIIPIAFGMALIGELICTFSFDDKIRSTYTIAIILNLVAAIGISIFVNVYISIGMASGMLLLPILFGIYTGTENSDSDALGWIKLVVKGVLCVAGLLSLCCFAIFFMPKEIWEEAAPTFILKAAIIASAISGLVAGVLLFWYVYAIGELETMRDGYWGKGYKASKGKKFVAEGTRYNPYFDRQESYGHYEDWTPEEKAKLEAEEAAYDNKKHGLH